MALEHLFFGRRQFLAGLMSSITMLVFGKIANVFNLFFQTSTATASEKHESEKKTLKGCVVYYSGTGSTAKIAAGIHRGIKSVMECDVAPIEKIDPKKMGKYDFVAVGTPIWFYRETANLRLFIYNMPQMTGKPCIIFCTHGTTPQGTFYSLAQPLTKKAFSIIGWNDWYGDCLQYKHAVQPYITHGHPDEIDLREAEAFGREMAERAQKIYAGEKGLIPELPTDSDENLLWRRKGIMGGGGGNMPARGSSGGGAPQMPEGAGMPGAVVAGNEGSAGIKSEGMSGAGAKEARVMAGPGGIGSGSKGNGAGRPEGMPGAGAEGPPGITNTGRGPGEGMSVSDNIPVIDTKKCIYPRCRACIDNCIANAIDLSMASTAAWVSGSRIFINGCQHCGFALCEKACSYDAIIYKGQKTEYSFDGAKCINPKCTLCIDHCPMKSLEFSKNMLVRHNNCEGCDLCWSICPADAIDIVNKEDRMTAGQLIVRLKQEIQEQPQYKHYRQLLPDGEWGKEGKQWYRTQRPRVVINEKDWPYEIKV